VRRIVVWWDERQVWLYLAAIALGAAVGLIAPVAAEPLEFAITPVLGLLLYATFLGIPFARFGRALRDVRFLGTVVVLNFVLVPVVVFALSRFVATDEALLVGVLLVLLTPCVDYVIVFAGLAGGARDRLLAATPLLMLLQILLLPAYLLLMAGPGVLSAFDPRPFVEAFLLLIVLPLALAALTQVAGRIGRRVQAFMAAAMVPLMMLTLAIVVASQVAEVGGALGSLLIVVPIFSVFVVIMVPLGLVTGRIARLDLPGQRAAIFSGVTRNSLVVLPLALALPAGFALTPLVVVTQTLIELVAMVVMVALVPRVVRAD